MIFYQPTNHLAHYNKILVKIMASAYINHNNLKTIHLKIYLTLDILPLFSSLKL